MWPCACYCFPGKFAQTLVVRVFTGDPSHWHNSPQDGLWFLASPEVTPPPQVDKDGLTRWVIPGLGGYLSGAGWGLSLYLGKVSPFLHTHVQVQILGRGSQATLLGERSMTGSEKAANREPWNTASSCCRSLKVLPAGETLGACAEHAAQNYLTQEGREQWYLYTSCL